MTRFLNKTLDARVTSTQRQTIALAMVLVFCFVGIGWWYSPRGQIQQVRWELSRLGKRVIYESRQKAILAFIKDGNYKKASAIYNSITNFEYKASASMFIIENTGTITNYPQISDYLEKALVITQKSI